MRSIPEWIGASDDTPIPPRVRLRVFDRDGGCCQCGCTRKIAAGENWETDHTVAIINGGENRELNLRTLLDEHHATKTKDDVREKSEVYQKRTRHLGIKRKSRMPGGRDSNIKIKMDGSVVDRRTGQPIGRG